MLYTGDKGNRFVTYVKDLVTSSERPLTSDEGSFEIEHEWSPDGHKVVLESARGLFGVYVTEGEKERQLYDSDPVWHPGGEDVALESTAKTSGSTNIWRVNAEGHDSYPLTEEPSQNVDPVCSPDGKSLAELQAWDGVEVGMVAGEQPGSKSDGGNPDDHVEASTAGRAQGTKGLGGQHGEFLGEWNDSRAARLSATGSQPSNSSVSLLKAAFLRSRAPEGRP